MLGSFLAPVFPLRSPTVLETGRANLPPSFGSGDHEFLNEFQDEPTNEELDRVDDVIGRAERITATVDVASRLTYKAMAPPLIKTLSFVKGAGRARRALRTPRRRTAIEVRGRRK